MYNKPTSLMPNNDEFKLYKDLLEENKPGACAACGGFLTLEKVNLEDYQGGKLYMMEQVPAYVCGECGEVWVPEPIMLEFEKMIQTGKKHHYKKKGRKKN